MKSVQCYQMFVEQMTSDYNEYAEVAWKDHKSDVRDNHYPCTNKQHYANFFTDQLNGRM